MFVIEGYKELIKELKEQIESLREENNDLREENNDLREENKDLREELKTASENPSELVDRMLSMSEAYENICAQNRELRYKLADYENAEKIAQRSERGK